MNEQTNLEMHQQSIERKLDEHICELKMYQETNQAMFRKLLESIKANTASNQVNNESITQLTMATKGVVEVYTASQGAIKVGGAVGRFVKWVSGFACVGVGITWLWSSLDNHAHIDMLSAWLP